MNFFRIAFLDYGENYFHGREKQWNIKFPTKENYDAADEIMDEFIEEWGEDLNDEAQKAWTENIINPLNDGTYVLPGKDDENEEENDDKENDILKEKLMKERIAWALPKSVKDIPYVAEIGSARYSVPDSTRSLDYLEENGLCLDNLRKGKSNIPQAGNGAFATRNISKNSIVVPAPLLPIKRDVLQMTWKNYNVHQDDDDDYDIEEVQMNQLLLNYCFGHPESSLLLFPYSSTVHFINNDNINPNAYLRWSKSEMNRVEMLDTEVDDVYAGIILEVVALRDIRIGEEVTIDYGVEWNDAWNDHVETWEIEHEESQINPESVIELLTMNRESETKPIRTMDEQTVNPYPTCVRTACYTQELKSAPWIFTKSKVENLRFCDITKREYQNSKYWYTAKIKLIEDDEAKDDENLVALIPQEAVVLIKDKYCSDFHLEGSFRHEIGVPNGIYPDIWMDVKDSDSQEAKVTCDTSAGQFTMLFHRKWSPIGYDRVLDLFVDGFYDQSHFFRVIPNFLVQFGIR